MARKSGWQEFTENFNGVYDTFNKAAQGIETSRIMNDEKFTGEGKAGAGLEGSALEAARYRALSDIQSKYGDVKGALETRNSYESLRNSARENVIGDATQDDVIFQRGAGASGLLRGQTNSANASANASNASAANSYSIIGDRAATQPFRLENQRLLNAGLGLDNTGKVLGNDNDALQLRLDTEAFGDDLRLRKIAVEQARASVDATRAGTGLNTARTDQITTLLPGRVADQLADLDLTKAQTNRIETLLSGEEALQGQQLQSAIAAMGLSAANTKQILALLPGKVAQTDAQTASIVANTQGQVLKNDADLAAANTRGVEAGFLTQISDPEWWKSQGVKGDPTPQQRTDALIEMYRNSDVPVERQMAVEGALNRHGIEKLQNVALETAQTAKNLYQEGGIEAVKDWYDTMDDGDKTKIDTRVVDGVHELYRSAGAGADRTETVLHRGASREELDAKFLGQIMDPGSGMEIAAAFLDMGNVAARTESSLATAEFTRENMKGLTGLQGLTDENIALANVRARQIRAELRQQYSAEGKAELGDLADQKALDRFLTETLPLLAYDDDLDLDALVQQFLTQRGAQPITFDPE